MAVYIESRWNDGYLAHHAQDVIRVQIIHRPEDGYLLSHDKEVIKEQLPLRQFVERLIQAEHRNQSSVATHRNKIESEIGRIEYALKERKTRELCEWLDHRYANLIRLGELKLMQHTYSVNVRRVDPQPHGVMEQMKQENMKAHYPMTTDEAYEKIPERKSVRDEEIYYAMIK